MKGCRFVESHINKKKAKQNKTEQKLKFKRSNKSHGIFFL